MDALKLLLTGASLALITSVAMANTAHDFKGLGAPATDEQIAGWNIDVFPDGTGLPPGEGTVAMGEKVYKTQCIGCHGVNLEGGMGPKLMGGQGSLATDTPVKTIGSYWPYATTVFDYVRRAMPFQSPQSLTNDEVYGVTAFLLSKNGILPADAKLDAKSLAAVRMPNRDNFYVDNRPDTQNVRCMTDCLKKSGANP